MADELPELELRRLVEFHEDSTIGELLAYGERICWMLELCWRNNARNVSCLPPGEYLCVPYMSNRFGRTFAFDDSETTPRTQIRMHAGNTSLDTRGCLLPGTACGIMGGRPAVLNSRRALDDLLREYTDGFRLTIRGTD